MLSDSTHALPLGSTKTDTVRLDRVLRASSRLVGYDDHGD